MIRRLLIIVPVVAALTLVSLFMPARRVSIEGVGKLSFETTVTLSVGSEVAYASPGWLGGWTYRRAISLSPTTSVANYQILVTLTTNIMGNPYANVKADGSDIRFTGSDGTTLQDYWVESWSSTGTSKIWVEVKTSVTSTIYMYYGNAAASSASNGANTFEFFDEGNQISSWTTGTVGTGSAGQSLTIGNPAPSYYVNSPSASSYAWMKRDIGLTTNKIIEFDMRTDTSLGQYYVLDVPFLISTGGYGQHFRLESRAGEKSGFAWKDNWTAFNWGAPTSGSAYSVGTWYKAKIEIGSTQANGWIDDGLQPTSPWTLRTIASNTFIGIEWSGRIDNIRVRKYASPEPSATVGSEEPAIFNTPASIAFGFVSENSPYWSHGSIPPTTFPLYDGECCFTVTNNSSAPVNISIKATNFTGGDGWALASSPGQNIVTLKAGKSGDTIEANMVTLTTSDLSFIAGLGAGLSKKWEIKLETGTFTDGANKSSTITLTATIP